MRNSNKIKQSIKDLLGNNFMSLIVLVQNTFIDFVRYYNYSNVFKKDSLNKLEALLILDYHSLEKCLLYKEMKFKYGKLKVVNLLRLLKKNEILSIRDKTQIIAAASVLCNYFDIHQDNNIDISGFFSDEDYRFLKRNFQPILDSTKSFNKQEYFKNSEGNFFDFSNSRSSIRDFTGERISHDLIYKIINLAKNAPSVCNRQPVKVYYIENKTTIDAVLKIQRGLEGFTDKIVQLLVVVSDRNYFYSVGERSQLFIDGGIFLLNLLYSLHYYKVGACPAHWALNFQHDREIKKLINMTNSEKVIALVAIGQPKDEFKTCYSKRRSVDEIIKIISS